MGVSGRNRLTLCCVAAAMVSGCTDAGVDGPGVASVCAPPSDERSGIISVDASTDSTCAAWSDGTVWCFGSNGLGQLGYTEASSSATPVPVTDLGCAAGVVVGAHHACAWLTDGTSRCWGDNSFGALGSADDYGGPVPIEVPGVSGVVAMSARGFVTGAVLENGAVLQWGLDVGRDPTRVELPAAQVLEVSNGHACAISSGSVWCWGINWYGQLGDGTTTDRYLPEPVAGMDSAVDLALGYGFTCALLDDGSVRCWGANDVGQLGNGSQEDELRPIQVPGLTNVVELRATDSRICARLADGMMACWGILSLHEDLVPVVDNRFHDVTHVALGDIHTCVVERSSTMRCWGYNAYGQLGTGHIERFCHEPAPVKWPWLE